MHHLFHCIQTNAEMQEIAATLFPTLYHSLLVIKYVAIGVGRHELKAILMKMEEIFPRTRQKQEEYQTDKWLSRIQRVNSYAVAITFVMALFNSYSKTIEKLMITKSTKFWEIELPYMFDYPYDQFQPFVYEVTFLSQWVQATFCVLTNCAITFMLYGLVEQTCMHFRHLADILIVEQSETIKVIVEKHIQIKE